MSKYSRHNNPPAGASSAEVALWDELFGIIYAADQKRKLREIKETEVK